MRLPRRRWWVLAALVVVLLGAVGVALSNRNKARPVSVEEAQERIGSQSTVEGATGRPRPGVYRYEGSGIDQLSFPSLSQPQGPTMPGSVELLEDGCWRFRVDFSSNHWQSWVFCRTGADLVETIGETWQRWMIGPQGFENLSRFDCEEGYILPAPRQPGQEWHERCVGSSEGAGAGGRTVSEGTYRFVGHVDLEVGTTNVRTAHFVRRRRYTGAQDGSERVDWWLDVSTGLPIRSRRSITAESDTVVGKTTYTETGDFRLASTDTAG